MLASLMGKILRDSSTEVTCPPKRSTVIILDWKIRKKVGVSDCTYYRGRKEYGGMRIEQAARGNS